MGAQGKMPFEEIALIRRCALTLFSLQALAFCRQLYNKHDEIQKYTYSSEAQNAPHQVSDFIVIYLYKDVNIRQKMSRIPLDYKIYVGT